MVYNWYWSFSEYPFAFADECSHKTIPPPGIWSPPPVRPSTSAAADLFVHGSVRVGPPGWEAWIGSLPSSYFPISKTDVAQPAARCSSPSFSGPFLPKTKKPMGVPTSTPPFSLRLAATLSAA